MTRDEAIDDLTAAVIRDACATQPADSHRCLTALALADIAESLRAIQLSLAQLGDRGGPVYGILERLSGAKEAE
jgi:hypothetical protein